VIPYLKVPVPYLQLSCVFSTGRYLCCYGDQIGPNKLWASVVDQDNFDEELDPDPTFHFI